MIYEDEYDNSLGVLEEYVKITDKMGTWFDKDLKKKMIDPTGFNQTCAYDPVFKKNEIITYFGQENETIDTSFEIFDWPSFSDGL